MQSSRVFFTNSCSLYLYWVLLRTVSTGRKFFLIIISVITSLFIDLLIANLLSYYCYYYHYPANNVMGNVNYVTHRSWCSAIISFKWKMAKWKDKKWCKMFLSYLVLLKLIQKLAWCQSQQIRKIFFFYKCRKLFLLFFFIVLTKN